MQGPEVIGADPAAGRADGLALQGAPDQVDAADLRRTQARTTAPRLGRISTTPMPARTINASRIGITPTPSLSASGWTISRWPGRSRPWTISMSRRSTRV